jgi:hypothetical protein
MAAERQHALLIGVDRYPFLPEKWQLEGCVHDVQALAGLLRGRFGFAPEDVRLLENEAATQEGIRSALDALRGRVGPGEPVVLAYSGHGSRLRDEDADEPDGWDETIVPADSGRGEHPSRDIRDDEIHAWLLALSEATSRITLVFDSCFSGGITRDSFAARVRGLPPDPRPATAARTVRGARRRDASRKGASGWLPWSDRYVLLAACRHDESAHEIVLEEGAGPVHHGAFSYFLQRELSAAGAEASHRDVFERAALQVAAAFPRRQHPQLEGARDRELFGERVFAPFRFLPVREREGSRVVLAGGAAQGLAVGAQWDVFPQGTRSAGPGVPRLARVEVQRVDAVRAEAVILEEGGEEGTGRSVQPGDRAVESAAVPPPMWLAVEVEGPPEPELEALRQALRAGRRLRLAEPGEPANLRVYRLAPRTAAGEGAPAPQLGAVREPLWVAVARAGEIEVPPVPVAGACAIARLVRHLETRAGYRLALGICNRGLDSALTGKIELRLLCRDGGGDWVPAEPDALQGSTVYREGDRLAFEMVNRAEVPVYSSVLDFGLSGRIALLYPVRGSHKAIVAGGSLRFGVRSGEELELIIPPEAPHGGIETLKLFATTEEADFTPLEQEGFQAVRAGGKSAPGLLADLLEGTRPGKRDARPVARSEGDWATAAQSFLLVG